MLSINKCSFNDFFFFCIIIKTILGTVGQTKESCYPSIQGPLDLENRELLKPSKRKLRRMAFQAMQPPIRTQNGLIENEVSLI